MPLFSLSLSGEWQFRFAEEAEWRPIAVPGCWEALGGRKDHAGPAWYRICFVIPAAFAGRRLWLRFEAVSYHCTVSVNGREVGSHTGLWDAFALICSDRADRVCYAPPRARFACDRSCTAA